MIRRTSGSSSTTSTRRPRPAASPSIPCPSRGVHPAGREVPHSGPPTARRERVVRPDAEQGRAHRLGVGLLRHLAKGRGDPLGVGDARGWVTLRARLDKRQKPRRGLARKCAREAPAQPKTPPALGRHTPASIRRPAAGGHPVAGASAAAARVPTRPPIRRRTAQHDGDRGHETTAFAHFARSSDVEISACSRDLEKVVVSVRGGRFGRPPARRVARDGGSDHRASWPPRTGLGPRRRRQT